MTCSRRRPSSRRWSAAQWQPSLDRAPRAAWRGGRPRRYGARRHGRDSPMRASTDRAWFRLAPAQAARRGASRRGRATRARRRNAQIPCLCADAAVRRSTAATRLPAGGSSPTHDGAGRWRVPRKRTCAVQPPRLRDLWWPAPRRVGMARDVWCETRGMADLDSRGWSPRLPRLPRHAQAAARQRAAGSSARGWLLLPRRLRHAQRPAYDAILKIGIGNLILAGADAPAHRNPRLVHGLGIARNEWVPPVEVASLGQKAIGATGRQPYDSLDISGG